MSIKKCLNEREHIEDVFLSHFENKGYKLTEPVPLLSPDKTLLFTNDTIAAWKKYLKDAKLPKKGVVTQQPSLRSHGVKDTIFDICQHEKQPDRFLGYFSSLGILASNDKNNNLCGQVEDLFINKYSIPPSQIQVFGRKNMDFLNFKQLPTSYEKRKDIYYEWDYGMSEVKGEGATIMLKQNKNIFKEIGQIIEVKDSKNILGYEFGFGAETFRTRNQALLDYRAWTIFHCVPEKARFKGYLDCLSSYGTIKAQDKTRINSKHQNVAWRYAKKIAKLEEITHVLPQETEESLSKFVEAEFEKEIGNMEELQKARYRQKQRRINTIYL